METNPFVSPARISTLSAQIRYIDYELPSTLTPGKYRLTAVLDAGTDIPLEAAQIEVEIN